MNDSKDMELILKARAWDREERNKLVRAIKADDAYSLLWDLQQARRNYTRALDNDISDEKPLAAFLSEVDEIIEEANLEFLYE